MNDPYQVLGISRSASLDEIKKAYRTLSRKYHPDANINNPNRLQAEERFKEIQKAYKQIIDEKENGYQSSAGFGSGYSGGFGSEYSYSGQNSYYQNQNASYQSDEYSMHLRAAANYINSRYYNEALNVLNQMQERNGRWYYLSAIANAGLGNNILALEHARQAAVLEPQNRQYAQLVYQLESGGIWYQNMQSSYGTPASSQSSVCMKVCLTYLMCNLCLGGGTCCNMGYYYPY